jgi:hypothetical protein
MDVFVVSAQEAVRQCDVQGPGTQPREHAGRSRIGGRDDQGRHGANEAGRAHVEQYRVVLERFVCVPETRSPVPTRPELVSPERGHDLKSREDRQIGVVLGVEQPVPKPLSGQCFDSAPATAEVTGLITVV